MSTIYNSIYTKQQNIKPTEQNKLIPN